MRVCVVGAGPAGLCATKHSLQHGLAVTVFEQSGDVGGTWQYTECVGRDEHGAPVHTSMYRDLRINLPKDVVFYPGFPHGDTEESYITSEEILEYLNRYADSFKLRDFCKFYHQVIRINRVKNEWLVTVLDLMSSMETSYTFDIVFICNGLNNKPYTPKVEGSALFEGHIMHSHEYRSPEPFSGQMVLVVGGGPSALDICDQISRHHHATKVLLSHHSPLINMSNLYLSDNVAVKTDVKRLLKQGTEFMNGEIESIDRVVFCTGFRCNYSFLDDSCEITVDNGFVYPLYKHIINANHPSMCILGNMNFSMQLPTFDIQVRFFLKSITSMILPEKGEMIREIQESVEMKTKDGQPPKTVFRTTADEDSEYYQQLVSMANIEPIPKVLCKIQARAATELLSNFPRFRHDKYTILDGDTYTVTSDLTDL